MIRPCWRWAGCWLSSSASRIEGIIVDPRGLARILNLFPAVPHLAVQTTAGRAYVARDFPSGYTKEV